MPKGERNSSSSRRYLSTHRSLSCEGMASRWQNSPSCSVSRYETWGGEGRGGEGGLIFTGDVIQPRLGLTCLARSLRFSKNQTSLLRKPGSFWMTSSSSTRQVKRGINPTMERTFMALLCPGSLRKARA